MSHSIRRTARWAGLAAMAATALVATACSSPAPAPASGDAASGERPGKTEITVVTAPINYEPVYLADSEGFFDEVGLDVTIKPGGTPQDNLAQVMGGSADLTIVSWDVAVTATSEGVPIKVISSNAVVSTEFDTSGVVVRADSGIESLADLEGKTIAFNDLGSGGNVAVKQAFEAAGVDPEKVEDVLIPFAGMQAALEGGQVDAAFPSDAFYGPLSQDPAYKVISNPSREFRGGLPITLWAATDPWLQENPGTADKFNEAMQKAADFYNDEANLDAVLAVRSEISGKPVEEVSKVLTPAALETPVDVAEATTQALKEFGFVEKEPKPVDEILWADAPRS
ncbi:ABC transporter substrate-binding protein [Microbacterium sp. NPDC096154]|uniref:ABC transporter substrate-binding protein n=1 Tax=Microbacterium sp. NPDC096154 TaxID=3155549 RepID=UPI003331D11E